MEAINRINRRASRTLLILLALCFALVTPSAAQDPVIHPQDDAVLNRRHVRFRWEAVEGIVSDYILEIVEDDGSPDPFTSGGFPVLNVTAGAAEPRIVVQNWLAWGTDYLWRVRAQTPASLPGYVVSPVRNFRVADLPPNFPDIVLTVRPGSAAPYPGITIVNISRPFLGAYGFVVAIDSRGEAIWIEPRPDVWAGDMRQLLGTGRVLVLERFLDVQGMNGDGYEINLNGDVVWHSTWKNGNVHHDVTPMPHGGVICVTEEFRDISFQGTVYNWKYDVIREFDRHSREEIWSWSGVDWFDVQDFRAQLGPGNDWVHGNACYYDASDDSIYYSARNLSRIVKIDHATATPLWMMGEDFPSGDATFGDNLFSMQHAPEALPNGNVLLFDNGNLIQPLTQPRRSRAVEIALDDLANPTSAQIVWSFDPVDSTGTPMYSPFVGDADRLPNGHTLVQHGQTSTLMECDALGNEIWRIQVGGGHPDASMYRADRIPALHVDTPGDTDEDQDLDLRDLLRMQVAFDAPSPLVFPETLSDMDGSGTLDNQDVLDFNYWMTGPARARDSRLQEFSEFCFGDDALAPGCAVCTCSNGVAPGAGTGCSNSGGRGARLLVSGSASASTGALRFDLQGGSTNSFAFLVSGRNALPNVPADIGPCPPGVGFGTGVMDGLRCVGGGVTRHGTRMLNAFGDSAATPWAPPMGAPAGLAIGEEHFFQAIYRDSISLGCGTGQNTSQGIRVRVTP